MNESSWVTRWTEELKLSWNRNECKPLPSSGGSAVSLFPSRVSSSSLAIPPMHAGSQGLTLVHFSAHPEPFLTQNAALASSHTP